MDTETGGRETVPQMQISSLEQVEGVELSSLPWVAFAETVKLPRVAAVYFALDDNELPLYVGRALNLKERWRDHHQVRALRRLGCQRLAWITAEAVDLDLIEALLIRRFNPVLNRRYIEQKSANTAKVETLITTKITMKALRLVRRIAIRTGEKQYRIWERLAEAEHEALNGKPTTKGKAK